MGNGTQMKTQRGGGSKLKRKLLFQAATKPPNQTYIGKTKTEYHY